jgi:DNA-binding MurR/RpiR family transcriptional regulator
MKKENTLAEQVGAYIERHPEKTWQQIAHDLGCGMSTVSRLAKTYGLGRPRVLRVNLGALKK